MTQTTSPSFSAGSTAAPDAVEPERFDDSIARALDKVVVGDGCWTWTASTVGSGEPYPQLWDGALRRSRVAHRIFFEQFRGPIPIGLQLDHLCRNTLCVKPSHLEPVTGAENLRRGTGWSGRHSRLTQCPQGHAYDYVDGQGRRRCRTCRREQWRAKSKRKTARLRAARAAA